MSSLFEPNDVPPRKGAKSLFEEEAERMTGLNKSKRKSDGTLLDAFLGITLGGGFVLLVFAIVFCPLAIYSVLSHGFVLSKLWGWFAVPLGLTPIGVLHAAGIMAIIRLCTYSIPDITKD